LSTKPVRELKEDLMARDWTVTLRIDTSAWSANREYPVTNIIPTGTGHAWLTVTAPNGSRVDIGYYPGDNGLVGPGQLFIGNGQHDGDNIAHQPHQDAAYTYRITADQASRILAGAGQLQANPGQYNLLTHNCLTVARDLMVQGGLAMPPLETGATGLGSWATWKAGTEVNAPPINGPAGYNSVLKSTTEGRAARELYEKSSELSGAKVDGDLTTLIHHAEAQAAYEGLVQPDPRQSSTYLGEVDSPTFLTGGGTADPQADPRQSSTYLGEVDSPTFLTGGGTADPQMSTVNAAGPSANPGMSVEHHVSDWGGMSHNDVGTSHNYPSVSADGGSCGGMPHTDPEMPSDPSAGHH
jgi:hypothetical protein